ncbi:MAG: PHP domain-containing protein [Christensenellales bacterium]|jgi:hypothetical protein
MNVELHDYDIYPKVVCTGSTVGITIQPLGLHAQFPDTVKLYISPLQERTYPLDDAQRSICNYDLKPDDNGCLCFDHSFASEQEYILRFTNRRGQDCRLSVYAVENDLAGLIPLMGDLHLHSIRSDASQDPAVIAAYMRKMGYDFIAITDHKNFSGSLECIDAYRDAPIEMCLMTGEEVHLPDCHLHCVHVGGQYSINAMVDTVFAELEKINPGITSHFPHMWTKMEGSSFPGTMTEAEFRSTIEAYADTLDPIPQGIPRYVYAGFCWICERIRAADGLSIFTHPYWIHDTSSNGLAFHADERLTQYLFEKQPFDAFEVLGGERYFEQNGLQSIHYYQALADGLRFPVVGSSDCHDQLAQPSALVASTICFAKENSTLAILDAIRARRSVAVDLISREFRLVGELRLVKYACFLMNNYFPLHQEACYEQGRAMKEYYCGDRDIGLKLLQTLDGRIRRMWKKYFNKDC